MLLLLLLLLMLMLLLILLVYLLSIVPCDCKQGKHFDLAAADDVAAAAATAVVIIAAVPDAAEVAYTIVVSIVSDVSALAAVA